MKMEKGMEMEKNMIMIKNKFLKEYIKMVEDGMGKDIMVKMIMTQQIHVHMNQKMVKDIFMNMIQVN